MGVVHRVHHKSWDVELAVKTPNSKLIRRPEILRIFEKEAEVWVGLPVHPNVVYCYYVTTLGSVPRIFMEYVRGMPLSECIRGRQLYKSDQDGSLRKVLDVAIQVAYGLEIAHARGLVHQDVKPGNILISSNWVAKVTDFGLVRALSASADADDDVPFLPGTPQYSPPELANGKPTTVKTDIWGWAATVTEMIVGRVAWKDHRELLDVLADHLHAPNEKAAIQDVPESLAQLLLDCFQQNPADRPADISAVSERLQSIYAELFGSACPYTQHVEGEESLESLNNRAVSLAGLGKNPLAEQVWNKILHADPTHFAARVQFCAASLASRPYFRLECAERVARAMRETSRGLAAEILAGNRS
jgi:serine/threonine protein kinase